MKTIPKQVLQGLKSVADETIEQGIDNVKKTVGLGNSTKNEQNLFADIKDMSDEQRGLLKKEDEERKEKEIDQIRQGMDQGRRVEGEMEEVRRQREEEEKKKEEEFLENLKRQRMVEEEERRKMAEVATPQHKRKKSRGSAFARGKKPSQDQMSATGEFSKKAD